MTQKGNELVNVEGNDQMVDPHYHLMQMVLEKGGDMSSLEKLMDLQERAERNQARKSFFLAFSGFQSDLPVVERGGNGNYGPYARIEDVADAIRPLLVKHGLCYRFEQLDTADSITVSCVVSHLDGHEIKTAMESGLDKSGNKQVIHQRASTVSYLRRYTLTGAFGIVVGGEDNDRGGGDDDPNNRDIPENITGAIEDEKFDDLFLKWEPLLSKGKKTAQNIIDQCEKGSKPIVLADYHKLALKAVKVME